MKPLAIDIGGTSVKVLACGQPESRELASGPSLTPQQMVHGVKLLAADFQYDAVTIGSPDPVVHGLKLMARDFASDAVAKPYPDRFMNGRIGLEPWNLGRGWVGCGFQAAFGRPVRLINDAAMQALGSYNGGKILLLGLGT